MAVYTGKWLEITSVEEVTTLPEIPEKLTLVSGNEGWEPDCVAEPITLVQFKFAPADGKIPTPKVGELIAEMDEWVRQSVEDGTLDTTKGIAFSGIMIAHLSFVLGHVTHVFPWAGVFEPRTGGGWVGHVHGAAHRVGDPFFLDLNSK